MDYQSRYSNSAMMVLLQVFFPLLFTFLLFLFMITRNRKISKLRLPPGPQRLPFIGNLHQLIGSLPHHSLKKLSEKFGPVMYLQLGEVPALIISSPEAAKEVMKTQDLMFADRPMFISISIATYNGKDIAFSPYGAYWRQLRKLCTLELLSSKRVQSFRSLREEEVDNLVKYISSSARVPIDLGKMILKFTNSVIRRAAFGDKCEDKDEFLLASKELVQLVGGFDVPDLFPSYKFLHLISKEKSTIKKLHARIDAILTKIIDVHKARRDSSLISDEGSSEEDLVDVLLKFQESSDLEVPITTDNIKAVILDMFGAGTETSSTTLQWALSELIRNPKIMEKAQAEVRNILKGKRRICEADIQDMNYLKLVIKETLRLHPPVVLLVPRESRKQCKINDYDIPIKTKVIVNAWAIGRDPGYWVSPECFDPERFNGSLIDFRGGSFEYIPFGAGRRICPGINFGIANVELPLAQLLYHFDWELPNGTKPEEFDMSEAFGAAVNRKDDLILIANPYSPKT